MTDNPRTNLLERAAVARLLAGKTTMPGLAEMLLDLAKVYEREAEDDKGATTKGVDERG